MARVDAEVLVIGAGPAGLAVAACLLRRGIDTLVVDRGESVGETWRSRYDRLHLHTPRVQSSLPGLRIPARFGRWVAKDDMAEYLRVYARRQRIAPRFATEVRRVDHDGRLWTATFDEGALSARQIVIATGYSNSPVRPNWPGQDGFGGAVVHASEYRNARPSPDATCSWWGRATPAPRSRPISRRAGAATVRLAIRTPPNIIPRQLGPVPTTLLAIGMEYSPAWLVDPVNRLLQRAVLGDLTPYGMPLATAGVVAQARATGVTPTIDVGLVESLRAGRVMPVAALERFDGGEVVLADGTRIAPDAVIAATGYTTGLVPVAGHLGVLDERGYPLVTGPRTLPTAPGLRFIGLSNPLKGQLLQIKLHARASARAVAKELRAS